MATVNYADAYQQAVQQAFYDGHLFSANLWNSPSNSVVKFDGAKHIKVPVLSIDEGRRDRARRTITQPNANYSNAWQSYELKNERYWSTLVDPSDVDESNMVISIANITKQFNLDEKMPKAVGDQFASVGEEPIFYHVKEVNTDLTALLVADETGTRPNGYQGQILPVTPNDALSWAEITSVAVPAKDDETDDHLRDRILSPDAYNAYGGNIADYLDMLSKIESVGAGQIYPTWRGGSTVKLVIVDNDLRAASPELLSQVKEAIDPVDAEEQGYGLVTIGHAVTVVAPTEVKIAIETTVSTATITTLAAVKPQILAGIESYFDLRRKAWDDVNQKTGRGYSLTVYRRRFEKP
ncbi:baseplate J/gp47 family protein [Levilactobacillus enshiensis]|uniref:baseplate J/gp47 family protein n=1 Tax=Levilactobacillus enshiensis TaxID=2590213 RepID=UPI00117AE51A|nr:baseplate J/gp47 family protein [Levilactobacillus enshiensis]